MIPSGSFMAPGSGTGTRVHYGGACSCQGANHERPSHHSHRLAEGLCYQHQPACLCLLNKPITFLNVSHTRVFNATQWSYGPLAGSQCRGHGLRSWNQASSSVVHCCVQPARRFLWMLSARAPQPLGTAEPALRAQLSQPSLARGGGCQPRGCRWPLVGLGGGDAHSPWCWAPGRAACGSSRRGRASG